MTTGRARPKPPLGVSNRWRTFLAIPAPVQAVRWQPFTRDDHGVQQHGITLRAERPPWRDLLAALDDLGRWRNGSAIWRFGIRIGTAWSSRPTSESLHRHGLGEVRRGRRR